MIELYLITGFLGAGKTTLMKNMMNVFRNRKIGVIVNEFGKKGVDGVLLQTQGIQITEINNGSIFCVCRTDLFINALIEALERDIELLFIETSGLADPTNMDKILDTVCSLSGNHYDYKGSIAVVDAKNFLNLTKAAVALPLQIAASQLVFVNKTDLVDDKTIALVEAKIQEYNPEAILHRTTFSTIQDPKWLLDLGVNTNENKKKVMLKKDLTSAKILVKFIQEPPKELLIKWLQCFTDLTYRTKGFVKLIEGWHYIDGVNEQLTITPSDLQKEQSFLVLLTGREKEVRQKMLQNFNQFFIVLD